jgi:hypothetical protein
MNLATSLDGIYLPMQLTDWPIVEVALLLIGLTHISLLSKTSFDPLGRDQTSFRLPAPSVFYICTGAKINSTHAATIGCEGKTLNVVVLPRNVLTIYI